MDMLIYYQHNLLWKITLLWKQINLIYYAFASEVDTKEDLMLEFQLSNSKKIFDKIFG